MASCTPVAIVTGASRGIGAAIAQKLSLDGYHVLALGRDAEALDAVVAGVVNRGYLATALVCDVTSPTDIARACCAATLLGDICVLVNNAGLGGPYRLAAEVSETEFDGVFQANVYGMARLSRLVIPDMVTRGYGRIVNIASVFGLGSGVGSSTYAASKHAVIGYTKSLAVELGGSGITANAVCPGYIATDMLESAPEAVKAGLVSRIPAGRLGAPEDVANLVAFLASPGAGYLNGAEVVIDGGLLAQV